MSVTCAAILAVFSFPAQASHACNTRAAALKHLSKKYGEAPVAIGLANNGGVLEVLASPGGSWTIIITMPNGVSCLLASGRSWEVVVPMKKKVKGTVS